MSERDIAQELGFEEVREGDVLTVKWRGKNLVDKDEIALFGKELLGYVSRGEKEILLDFTNIERISSAALGELIKFSQKTTDACTLTLCMPKGKMYETFRIAKMWTVFHIYTDLEEAMAALRR